MVGMKTGAGIRCLGQVPCPVLDHQQTVRKPNSSSLNLNRSLSTVYFSRLQSYCKPDIKEGFLIPQLFSLGIECLSGRKQMRCMKLMYGGKLCDRVILLSAQLFSEGKFGLFFQVSRAMAFFLFLYSLLKIPLCTHFSSNILYHIRGLDFIISNCEYVVCGNVSSFFLCLQ